MQSLYITLLVKVSSTLKFITCCTVPNLPATSVAHVTGSNTATTNLQCCVSMHLLLLGPPSAIYLLIERSVWDSPGIDYGLEFFFGKASPLHQSECPLELRNTSNCERKVWPLSD